MNPAHKSGEPIVSNGTIYDSRLRVSVENVAERFEPTAFPSRTTPVVVIIIVIVIANVSRWWVVSPRREFIVLARSAGDELLQLPAVEPNTLALETYVDDHAVSHPFVQHGSLATRAVHVVYLLFERRK
jgi:hypothetical protein